MKALALSMTLVVSLAATQARAADVPGGVYDCFGRLAANGYTPDRGAGIRSPSVTGVSTSASKFSVIAPGRYLSRGGTKGKYKFDGQTLTLVDGPYAGLRFHKVSPEWTFRMLNPDGSENAVMCPRNTGKDPQQPNAW
jgi:hypothetical protein